MLADLNTDRARFVAILVVNSIRRIRRKRAKASDFGALIGGNEAPSNEGPSLSSFHSLQRRSSGIMARTNADCFGVQYPGDRCKLLLQHLWFTLVHAGCEQSALAIVIVSSLAFREETWAQSAGPAPSIRRTESLPGVFGQNGYGSLRHASLVNWFIA